MSVITRENEKIGKVFDELFLSRRVIKKAEGTQTPKQKEVPLPGEVPDACVSTLIDMLTPSLRQHCSSKSAPQNSGDEHNESSPLLAEVEAVDRSCSTAENVLLKKSSSVAMREVFEELCLSRKKTSFTLTNGMPSTEAHAQQKNGEAPDEGITSMIGMLRPTVRQSSKKNSVSFAREKPEEITECPESTLRTYHSEPTVGPLKQPSSSEVSLDSIFTTPSNLTNTIDDNMIKTLLASPNQMDEPVDKEVVETGSNTESSGKYSRRKSKKRRKKSKVKLIKETGTDTMYQTEDSTNQTEDMSSKETEVLKDRIKSETKMVEIKEQCRVSAKEEKIQPQEVQVDNNITVLRNKTDWTNTPFLTQDSSETVEESTSNVDSEPTRGCPSSLEYNIQFNRKDQNNSDIKTEIKRFKAILNPVKRLIEKKECEYKQKQGIECSKFFSKPFTSAVKSPLEVASLDDKIKDKMFPSHNSLCSPGSTAGTSLTSIRTYSCCSSYGEEKLANCCCHTVLTDNPNPTGEPKVFWAITKINVYPDDSRTYEVMPLTGKKPAELPEKSDSVFVLIPPKPGQFVPSKLE